MSEKQELFGLIGNTIVATAVAVSYYLYRKNQIVEDDDQCCDDQYYDKDEDECIEELKVKTVYNYIVKSHRNNEDWQSQLKTVYQNYIMIDSKIVFVDGFSTKSLFPTCTLRISILYQIAQIAIDYNFAKYESWMYEDIKTYEGGDFKTYEGPIHRYSYNYHNYDKYDNDLSNEVKEDDRKFNTKICSATMRPYTVDQVTGNLWRDEAIKSFGPLDNQVYTYNYFGTFVKKYKKYPTKDEFILFIYRRMKLRGFNTLPKNITIIVDKLWLSYELILGTNFEKVNAKDFIKLFNDSCDTQQRILIENTHKNWTMIESE
jgi:hypothetical protein